MLESSLYPVCLIAVAVLAAASDVRERRIPNWLTVGGLALALGLRLVDGWGVLAAGLLGAGICFVLAVPFFLAGGAGGGDVKLLTALGAFLGPARLPTALFVMAIVGGLLAVVQIVRKGSIPEVAGNLRAIVTTFGRRTFTGWKGEESEAALTLDSPGALTVPYGIAIAAGAIAGWYL